MRRVRGVGRPGVGEQDEDLGLGGTRSLNSRGAPDVSQLPLRAICTVQGSGYRAQGSGFRVQGSGFRVQGSGFKVQDSGFRVQDSRFRVESSR